MLATFEIRVKDPVDSAAVPVNGVVRENDGTMVVWATTDRHRFVRKVVKLGLQKEGRYQVLEGVRRGELVVADGAIFLSNMLLPAAND
jgi:cobalt-zinc-cadmium efflux system membrane fusion protein